MKLSLNNTILFKTNEEIPNTSWPAWKIILLISVFVVFFIGLFTYIYLHKKVKKIKEKYFLDQENEILLKASENNKNFGTIITNLEKETTNPLANPILTAFLLNTFIVNNFTSVFIDDKYDNYFAKTISLSTNTKFITITNNNSNDFIYKKQLDTKNDMIILLNQESDAINYLEKNLNFLNDKGMCIFLYNKYNKKEVNDILNYLYDKKTYKFEKNKIKSFNLILITNYHKRTQYE
ncbi:BC85_0335 family putative methyltransferase [Mycoplasma miroungirhinis]|uniref:Uncharacterized protein n=1 Tax=Mycoplasma miroungirhinis TaxID=754516 RepID=A0A6M4JD92_9MOLU|nr:hypothetical protein [Mycoplasma miroungirhinis]QJR44047.1 hypothetical protein HLA92_01165 [Mycoplasma miroungirhinis]